MNTQSFLASYQFLGLNGGQGYGTSQVRLFVDSKGLPHLVSIQNAETNLAAEHGIEPGKLIITNLIAISDESY